MLICVYSLVKCLLKSSALFFNWIILLLSFESTLYILGTNSLSDMYVICKYFLPVCSLSFHSLNSEIYRTDVFSFEKIYFFSFMDYAFGVISKNSSHKDFLFPYKNLIVEHFTCRSVINFELTFLHDV